MARTRGRKTAVGGKKKGQLVKSDGLQEGLQSSPTRKEQIGSGEKIVANREPLRPKPGEKANEPKGRTSSPAIRTHCAGDWINL